MKTKKSIEYKGIKADGDLEAMFEQIRKEFGKGIPVKSVLVKYGTADEE